MVGNVMLKRDILRRKEDFDLIYKKGRSVGERYIVLFYMKNGLSYNRIASVSYTHLDVYKRQSSFSLSSLFFLA